MRKAASVYAMEEGVGLKGLDIGRIGTICVSSGFERQHSDKRGRGLDLLRARAAAVG